MPSDPVLRAALGSPELSSLHLVSPAVRQFAILRLLRFSVYKPVLFTKLRDKGCSPDVDYFPRYEIVQNSDRAAVWEPDRRHVKVAGAHHIMELVPAVLFG
jgi:hypothetical protein